MWKTPRGNSFPEALSCHLCPDCDSLGPHVIMADDLPGDAWLECIDCGAVLGSVMPQGIPTPVEPEPMDGEEGLRARPRRVPASSIHPGRAPNINLIAALLGWTRKA
ncbi:MAG: hypothetical protein OEU26_18280 [Candidatus Tectomicrobia bacterium]|nr:hypothetical protein [Candidatus Tectomicrobia bacterium]